MAESIYSSNDFGLGGRVVARASELRDNRTYRKLKAESERRGVPLEILTEPEFAAATGQAAPAFQSIHLHPSTSKSQYSSPFR